MSRSVREVHAAAGDLLKQVAESRALMDRLPLSDLHLTDHRSTLKSVADKLKEARRLAVEADHDYDHHQGAENLLEQAKAALHAEGVFINRQQMAASGRYSL